MNRLVGNPGVWVAALIVLALLASASAAEHQKFFERHCVRCHGAAEQEAELRFDMLAAPTTAADSAEVWSRVAKALWNGDMSPRGEPRPDAAEVKRLLTWIGGEFGRAVSPAMALRRLNRTEYEHTIHDLLGIDTPLAERLPEDTGRQGFSNVAGRPGGSEVVVLPGIMELGQTGVSAPLI